MKTLNKYRVRLGCTNTQHTCKKIGKLCNIRDDQVFSFELQ